MSRERIAKLEALLARVERRRSEPRLVAVTRGAQVESANTNLGAPRQVRPSPSRPGPTSVPPPTSVAAPLEAAMSQLAMDSATRRASSLPPVPPLGEVAQRLATPAPPSIEPSLHTPTEVLPVAHVRISPLPPAPFDAAVKVVSSPRSEAPRSFGDLLTLSLSLRPK